MNVVMLGLLRESWTVRRAPLAPEATHRRWSFLTPWRMQVSIRYLLGISNLHLPARLCRVRRGSAMVTETWIVREWGALQLASPILLDGSALVREPLGRAVCKMTMLNRLHSLAILLLAHCL